MSNEDKDAHTLFERYDFPKNRPDHFALKVQKLKDKSLKHALVELFEKKYGNQLPYFRRAALILPNPNKGGRRTRRAHKNKKRTNKSRRHRR